MKIGIITIQKSEVNFGACLQSFALWRFISSLGYDCEVIDLLRPCHASYKISKEFGERQKPLKERFKRFPKSVICYLLGVFSKSNSLKKFHLFNNKIRYSKEYRSVEQLYNDKVDYDILVSGSDQIWNPQMPFVNEPYFLTFAPKECKRIAYASSFGIDSIDKAVSDRYRMWLEEYDSLSTREDSGATIINGLIDREVPVVLDPVFLLAADDWRQEMASYKRLQYGAYVLLYMLKFNEKVFNHAIAISKEKHLPLYFVLSENRVIKTEEASQIIDIGPAEWMWLIDNANTMITSSFHGTAFSTIFNTPFIVFLKKGSPTNTRIEGLSSKLDLSGHIYYEDDEIDYSSIDSSFKQESGIVLKNERDKSIDYIYSALVK